MSASRATSSSSSRADLQAERELGRGLPGRPEETRVEIMARARVLEAELARDEREAAREKLRVGAVAAHALAEARIVILAAACLLDERHDVRGAAGLMILEPLAKQALELMRQPQEHVSRAARSCGTGRAQDGFHLMIGERGNDRGHQHT